MDDVTALKRLAALLPADYDPELRRWLGAQWLAAHAARQAPRRFAHAGLRGQYLVGRDDAPTAWATAGVGAVVLAQAVLNPGRWFTLRPGRKLGAYSAAIGRTVEVLARIDVNLANALAPAQSAHAPGVRLRSMHSGRTECRWLPHSAVRVSGNSAPTVKRPSSLWPGQGPL